MDYYLEINNRAKDTYQGPELTKDNFDETWVPHWFATAEKLRDEFAEQSLPATADHVQSIIDSARKFRA